MRYVRVELHPSGGGVHPLDRCLRDAEAVRREAIVSLDIFCGGSAGLLYHLTGDPSSLSVDPGSLDSVNQWSPFQAPNSETDREWYAYGHVTPGGIAVDLLRPIYENGLLIDTPIEYPDSDTIRMTLVGPQDGIQTVYQRLGTVTECNVTSTGSYDPADGGLFAELTPRQRTVLRTAIEAGYYDVPKRVTHRDLAAELGCSTSTIDEHLRKAESRIFQAIVR